MTYSEQRFDGKRTFQLFPDRVVVRGAETLSSDYEQTIPVATLTPETTTIRYRHPQASSAFWMMAVSMAGLFVLMGYFHMPIEATPVVITAGLGVIGLLLAVATYKKVEFVVFRSDAGVDVLSVARSGKQVGTFNAFVEGLRRQIQSARQTKN